MREFWCGTSSGLFLRMCVRGGEGECRRSESNAMVDDRHLLFIEPQEPPTSRPVMDSVTRKMCAAFRLARMSDYGYGGVHECRCRAMSSSCDHFLPDGVKTNSLCIHYVAHHRASVPPEQIKL